MNMRLLTIIGSIVGFAAFGQTTLIEEDFSNGIPTNFILFNDNNTPHSSVSEYTEAWITVGNLDTAHETVASATSYFSPVGQANRWMIIPNQQLGAFGNFLSWDMSAHDISFLENLKVLISTTGTNVADFTDTLYLNRSIDTSWTNVQMNLAELGYTNQEVHIAFVLQTVDGFKFYLDNINLVSESDLSIQDLIAGDIKVSNPFKEELLIQSADEVIKISLINLNGQIILQSKDKQIDTTTMTPGVYMIQVETEKGHFKTKVVKA